MQKFMDIFLFLLTFVSCKSSNYDAIYAKGAKKIFRNRQIL